jgi:hypothetical protein
MGMVQWLAVSSDNVSDDPIGCFLIAMGILFVGFIIFFATVVGPAIHEKGNQHAACIEKGGIWVDSSRACLKPDRLMP